LNYLLRLEESGHDKQWAARSDGGGEAGRIVRPKSTLELVNLTP
jgi:hypothetical protein